MNDIFAIATPTMNVPPHAASADARPWWAVRRRLAYFLVLLSALWLVLSLQRAHIDQWLVKDLPVDDSIVLRLTGH